LANEAGEIVVFEVFGKQILSEIGLFPNDKSVSRFAPGNNVVGGRVVHQQIRLRQKRRWRRTL